MGILNLFLRSFLLFSLAVGNIIYEVEKPYIEKYAGEQEVVRMDVLFSGGRWQQSQKLQALFTNRMLREGTTKYTAATIAEKI